MMLHRLRQVDCCAVLDALDAKDLRHQVLHGSMPGFDMCCRTIITVQLAGAQELKGAEALVIDGATRRIDDIRSMGFSRFQTRATRQGGSMSTREKLANLKSHQVLINHPDRISGGLLMIVAGTALFEALHLPFGSLRAPDAGFFPLCLSTLLLVFAAGIVLNSFMTTKPGRTDFSARSWYVVIAAAAFVVYALSLAKVGFVLSTITIMLLVMRGLGGMSWARALLIAVPGVLLSYLAFVELGVPLPRGLLPF
jgi:hypothetical protein